MNKLFVKICGLTRAQDAELAAGLGASALGFVFWANSPRYVSASVAKGIAARRTVLKVGVFVDRRSRRSRGHGRGRTDVAQLHGHDSPSIVVT